MIDVKTGLILLLAIACEVAATASLKLSEGFTRLGPVLLVVAGYGASFYLLSISLKVIPIGVAYAIWSGVGIVLTTAIGMVLWREPMDGARGLGILLILSGVLVVNLSSPASPH